MLTARAAVLAVALASVVLALALPFKVWVAQRGQIHALETQTRDAKARIAQLRREQQRWNDPAYIREQARQRLHFVMPGETAYIVLDDRTPAGTRSAVPRPVATQLRGPWYSRLWESVEVAGKTTARS